MRTRTRRAAAAFEKAAEVIPPTRDLLLPRHARRGQNKIPEAIANLEKYLSMNPTNAQNTPPQGSRRPQAQEVT
jgi:hypothetical protein